MSSLSKDIEILKGLILDNAIRGMLVAQNPDEEDINSIFEKIVINKTLPKIDSNEIPFSIPSSWRWVRLGEVTSWKIGKTPSTKEDKYWKNGNISWLSIGDMPNQGNIETVSKKVTGVASKEVFKYPPLPVGTLLMSFKLSIGKVSISNIELYHNEAIISFCELDASFKDYLFWILPLICKTGITKKAVKGNTLNTTSLSMLVLPLPPFQEQRRIASKIKSLFKLCEEMEQNGQSVKEKILHLKSAILQEAVSGKLVPQNPKDENAEVLLEKIYKEKEQLIKQGKIKRDKPLPAIKDSEIPFDIPDNWKWVRLGELIVNINGRAFKPSEWENAGLPIIRIQNLNNPSAKFNYFKGSIQDKYIVEKNDLLVGWSGTPGTSFGAFIWDGPKAVLNQHIFNSKPYLKSMPKEFLKLLINSRLNEMISKAHGGVGLRHITKEKFDNMPVPLPPISIQLQIVEKITNLNNLLNGLIEGINS